MMEGRGAGGRRKPDRIEDSVGAIVSIRIFHSLTAITASTRLANVRVLACEWKSWSIVGYLLSSRRERGWKTRLEIVTVFLLPTNA